MKKLHLIGIVALISVLLISCLDTDDQDYIDPNNSAWIALINASPGSSDLKFYNKGTALNSPELAYGGFYGYFNQIKGAASFTVRKQGSEDLDTLNMNLVADNYYSVFAIDTPQELQLISYIDNHSAAPAGKSLIRFIQLSPDAPKLKLLIENEDQDLGTYLFKEASPFMEVQSGVTKNFSLVNPETDEVIFTKKITLNNGKTYSIFSKGLIDTSEDNKELDIQSILLQ